MERPSLVVSDLSAWLEGRGRLGSTPAEAEYASGVRDVTRSRLSRAVVLKTDFPP